MTVTATQYPTSPNHGIDYNVDTIKVALVEAYTFDGTNEFWSDIITEITGTGYSAGGVTLGSFVSSYDSGTKTWKFVPDDAVWTGATFTTGGAIVYKDTGTDSTSPLIGYVDFGADQTPVSTTFTLHINAAGLLTRQIVAAS